MKCNFNVPIASRTLKCHMGWCKYMEICKGFRFPGLFIYYPPGSCSPPSALSDGSFPRTPSPFFILVKVRSPFFEMGVIHLLSRVKLSNNVTCIYIFRYLRCIEFVLWAHEFPYIFQGLGFFNVYLINGFFHGLPLCRWRPTVDHWMAFWIRITRHIASL